MVLRYSALPRDIASGEGLIRLDVDPTVDSVVTTREIHFERQETDLRSAVRKAVENEAS